jgi:hypothetical protein
MISEATPSEHVRLQAAQMFAQDADAGQIARSLRVSTKSVYQWRRAWRVCREKALASKGPGGNPCKLDETQVAQLRAALEAGPAAYGWEQDQYTPLLSGSVRTPTRLRVAMSHRYVLLSPSTTASVFPFGRNASELGESDWSPKAASGF